MPSLLSRLGLAAASLLLVVGVAEFVARSLYSAPWYERLAAEQSESENFDYRLGPLLIRDQLPTGPKLADSRRIMVIGDSFTFGLGVRNEQAVFPRVLERLLNEAPPIGDASRFEVLNAGRPGSLTHNWIALWDGLHEAFAPDLLLVVFFLRDGTNLLSNPVFFDRIRDEIVTRNERSGWYRNSFLVRAVRDALDRRSLGDEFASAFHDAYFGDADQTEEWQAAQRNLVQLRNQAQKRGVAFGFAVFPVLAGLDEDYAFAAICERLESFARDEGMPVHNLLESFRGRHGPDLWVSAFDQHPNESAHAIAAESLLPFVTQLLRETPRY